MEMLMMTIIMMIVISLKAILIFIKLNIQNGNKWKISQKIYSNSLFFQNEAKYI